MLAVFLFECTPAWQVAEAPDVPRLDLDMAVPVAAVTGTEAAPSEPSSSACPGAMVLVDGMYCPNLTQVCLRWVDPPTDMYPNTRCAEFKHPATCQGERVHERYCIDRDEYVRPPDVLPLVHLDWNDAEAACEERGERLCTEAQWELACEGEQMLPYPYGASRDSSACNFDRTDLGKMGEGLTDHRVTPGAFPACVSPFGVSDMVGNVDEWTVRAGASAPNRSALHGGWWLPGRNNCRAATLGHTEDYSGKQVGFRCCAPARP